MFGVWIRVRSTGEHGQSEDMMMDSSIVEGLAIGACYGLFAVAW